MEEKQIVLHDNKKYEIEDLIDLGFARFRLENGDELSMQDIGKLLSLPSSILNEESAQELHTLALQKEKEWKETQKILSFPKVQQGISYLEEFVCCMLAFRFATRKDVRTDLLIQQQGQIFFALPDLLQKAIGHASVKLLRPLRFPAFESVHFQPGYPQTLGEFLDLLTELGKGEIKTTTVYSDTQTFLADLLRFVQSHMKILQKSLPHTQISSENISREQMVRHDEKSLCKHPRICEKPEVQLSPELLLKTWDRYLSLASASERRRRTKRKYFA